MNTKTLKIVYGYPDFPSVAYGDVEKQTIEYIDRLNKAGFNVKPLCLTIDPPAQCLSFKEIDRMWKWRDRKLLSFYENIEMQISGTDVLLNSTGINLHPEFVESLPVFTVFQCFDDPESSDHLSKPVATAYDLCLVGNVAEVDTYKSWGVTNVDHTTLCITPEFYDTSLTYEKIVEGERDIDLFMMIDRLSPWRKERMDSLLAAFPDAHFYGRGWPKGYLPFKNQVEFLKRSKIGPNVHNSTGPINNRTFYLPANGVMQICDNKSHLGKLYELGKEVVGFDNITECIDLCKYYLTHDNERREIAANGWKRATTDYTETAVFERTCNIISRYMENKFRKTEKRDIKINYDQKDYIRTVIYTCLLKPAIRLKGFLSHIKTVIFTKMNSC